MRGCRAAPAKGFIENRLLQERLTPLLSPPSIGTIQTPRVLAQPHRQTPCRAQNIGQTPSERATPGACPGLASDPSAGPRVNKNHQMERKLFFHRGKRLPFGDLQRRSARRLRPQVKWGSPGAPSGSPAHHRGTAQKGHGRPTSFPPRHVAGEE